MTTLWKSNLYLIEIFIDTIIQNLEMRDNVDRLKANEKKLSFPSVSVVYLRSKGVDGRIMY